MRKEYKGFGIGLVLLAVAVGGAAQVIAQEASSFPDLTPLIVTPAHKAEPRFNGAKVFGVRPDSPILYTLAVAGERPMKFSAKGLPKGVKFDKKRGLITGRLAIPGTHIITLQATNKAGSAERDLKLIVGNDFSLTPPMGCNTWGGLGPNVSEAGVRASAQAMALKLRDHGYSYVNIDDGWQGIRGGKYNAIQPNEKFGDMKKLCDDLHKMGLKLGLYSTPWRTSYAGFCGGSSDDPDGTWAKLPPGGKKGWTHAPYRFEINDALQCGAWGVDYFKYDWSIRDYVDLAMKIKLALLATDRDIVLELSNTAPLAKGDIYTQIGNMTRTDGDLVDVWSKTQLDKGKQRWALGVRDLWIAHKEWQKFNVPGHWNMPCPLRVGMLGGWDNKPLRPTRLTPDEQYSHMSLWCLWAAPIIIGAPLDKLDDFTLSLLTNDEMLDVNQDALGLQATDIDVAGGEALIKKMEDGSVAIGLFNPGEVGSDVSIKWAEAGVKGKQRVRDLWRQKDLGVFEDSFKATVPSHGVVVVRLFAQ
ncbi:MAG: glycoside hydrolase family 27 protein [Kiritimatiellae bacterium]|nr:glycoside hydrolase family 27 protein [Kiritimatiellia bacterium]